MLIVSVIVFVLAYSLIISEKTDRMVAALGGASLMVLFRVLSQEEAFREIDFNTIGLLTGMMLMVMVLRQTGLFEYLAVRMARLTRGNPLYLLILLSLVTGLLSALLDNVTTIMLILPVALSIARDLKINPVPMIISTVFASNVGGTATLVGDPPNIMIGSATGMSFVDFLRTNALFSLGLLVLTTFLMAFFSRRHLKASPEARQTVLAMDPSLCITDRRLLVKSLLILGLTLTGFLLHGVLHYESSTVALAGAVVLLAISGLSVEKILHGVEWKTILFFCGLFVMVGGLKATGVIGLLAEKVLAATGGELRLTTLSILWVSAIASAFVDNIPFVATMIPLIQDITQQTGMLPEPLWVALSLGACLGGNGTIIGASANVIAVGLAEEHGHPISFLRFLRAAFPMMLFTVLAASVYLWVFWL